MKIIYLTEREMEWFDLISEISLITAIALVGVWLGMFIFIKFY
jgi:hypothetical protein